jgi:multidrug efflux pump subunit AcrA (membrane-fusion protein)
VTFVIAAIAAAVILPNIGKAPVVNLGDIPATSAASSTSGNSIQLSFQASGRVAAVNVSEGSIVTKGQVLASLDTSVAASAVSQAKAALNLAKAQYSAANLQYQNAEPQQDTLVNNAYRTLLSSGLSARSIGVIDEIHNPIVSGTYACTKEGSYEIDLYSSWSASKYSFTYSGLESGNGNVTYGTPQPLGSCGLYVTFVPGFAGSYSKWVIDIPNIDSQSYQANKNAYDLAVGTRQQTLSQLSASIGQNGSAPDAAVASAAISVAEGAYQSALAQYANSIITAPADGVVSFVDTSLKVGQSISAGQRVVSLTIK